MASTPALGKAVFDYQFEIQQARDAAREIDAAGNATEANPQQPADPRQAAG